MADRDELGGTGVELVVHKVSIMFEQLRSDNRLFMETMLQRFDDVIAHADRRFEAIEARLDILEGVVRQQSIEIGLLKQATLELQADQRRLWVEVRRNSEGIQKNSEDIVALKAETERLRASIDRIDARLSKVDEARVEALEERVSALEERVGVRR